MEETPGSRPRIDDCTALCQVLPTVALAGWIAGNLPVWEANNQGHAPWSLHLPLVTLCALAVLARLIDHLDARTPQYPPGASWRILGAGSLLYMAGAVLSWPLDLALQHSLYAAPSPHLSEASGATYLAALLLLGAGICLLRHAPRQSWREFQPLFWGFAVILLLSGSPLYRLTRSYPSDRATPKCQCQHTNWTPFRKETVHGTS